MARPRVAASPLLVLGVAWALAALALGPAPAAPAATVARAQEQALARAHGAEGAEGAWEPSGAGRQRRSPREEMEAQQDETEPVDPEQKPKDKPGFFKRFLDKVREMASKAVEFAKKGLHVIREMMDAMGCFDQGKRNGGGGGGGGGSGGGGGGGGGGSGGGDGDNAETMSPDRLQSEADSGK